MPVVVKVGQLIGTATTLDAPEKLARAVELYCEAKGGEVAAGWTDQEKVDFVAEAIAQQLRREARRYAVAKAERAAAIEAEQSEEL